MKKKVLFVCIHNSARSQMAEEMLRKLGGEDFFTESAGIEPGQLNPIVVKVLQEEGINIAGKKTQAVADLIQEKRQYDYVITVCDETSAERCPMFPGKHQRIHWSFTDPSQFVGTDEEKMEKVRVVKGEIEAKLKSWLTSLAK
ncbi:MAG: arsenate reductase ArsC [Candidatus Omnitrophica bacterium]|nr:arsenate reductase ArsC [Candidatus Omnitrophota bacterium]MCB9748064.1 arsenate reductase ArsC [Candidatus Omnitrophota bacterium]